VHPVLVELPIPGGTRPVGAYGVCLALALLVGGALFVRRAARAGLDVGRVCAALAVAIGGALAGAWLLFVGVEGLRTGDVGHAIARGGLVFLGGLVGGAGALAVVVRPLRLPLGVLADCSVPALPLGHALGRLGCLLGGCCFGAPWDGALAITYADMRAPAAHPSVPRHAWPIYESLALLLVAGVVVTWRAARRRSPHDGSAFALYAALYGVVRFVLEPLRGDALRGLVLGVSTSQWLGACVALTGCVWLARRRPLRA
jgi:phosphatidylglycerol:prolipoprotein diacylglycerol transferase